MQCLCKDVIILYVACLWLLIYSLSLLGSHLILCCLYMTIMYSMSCLDVIILYFVYIWPLTSSLDVILFYVVYIYWEELKTKFCFKFVWIKSNKSNNCGYKICYSYQTSLTEGGGLNQLFLLKTKLKFLVPLNIWLLMYSLSLLGCQNIIVCLNRTIMYSLSFLGWHLILCCLYNWAETWDFQ